MACLGAGAAVLAHIYSSNSTTYLSLSSLLLYCCSSAQHNKRSVKAAPSHSRPPPSTHSSCVCRTLNHWRNQSHPDAMLPCHAVPAILHGLLAKNALQHRCSTLPAREAAPGPGPRGQFSREGVSLQSSSMQRHKTQQQQVRAQDSAAVMLLWLAAGAGSCQACCLQPAAGVELTRQMSTATLVLQPVGNPPAGQLLLLLLLRRPPPLLLTGGCCCCWWRGRGIHKRSSGRCPGCPNGCGISQHLSGC